MEFQTQMLANRLQKRFRHLKKWALRNGIGAFRLYDRDIPEIPLVLDFYGDCKKIEEAAICGALYKRPYEKDPDDEEAWLSIMKTSAASALEIKPEHIFIKQRQKQKGASQYEKLSAARFERIIGEGGLSFKVNLSDYLDAGLFIDRRLMRDLVRKEASGKKVLNLFSYTGSFSVYAAAGGAVSTDSVDLSNTYQHWAQENFSLNGYSANHLQSWEFFENKSHINNQKYSVHKLIRADALDFLEKATSKKYRWNIIILDPPAFSNSKKMSANLDLNRDLTELLNQCFGILAPDGKIFLSVNTRRGAPAAGELQKQLTLDKNNILVTDLENKITDEDFRGRKTPKAFLLEKNPC